MKSEDCALAVTVIGVMTGFASIALRRPLAAFAAVAIMFGGLLWQLWILEKQGKEK